MLIFFSFQSFTLQWGHNVTWVSCENQLQPVDSYLETIYILFNINHTAVFGLVNSTNGKYIVVYKFTESWTWASFIKLESTNIVLGFQDSTSSYVKIYNYTGIVATYILKPTIKLYGIANSIPFYTV